MTFVGVYTAASNKIGEFPDGLVEFRSATNKSIDTWSNFIGGSRDLEPGKPRSHRLCPFNNEFSIYFHPKPVEFLFTSFPAIDFLVNVLSRYIP